MKIEYFKKPSSNLQRDMECKVYGHAGKPILVFPSQDGRFFDFENQGMVSTVQSYIEDGKIQLFCVDSIDLESWSNENWDGRNRIARHEAWFNYVCEEAIPFFKTINNNGKFMTTGCSMGGAHSLNFLLRRPDLFDATIALSGVYNAEYFFKGYMDDLVYKNSPIHYMSNMSIDHPYVNLFRQSSITLCVGQGLWEEEMIRDTKDMQHIFNRLAIPAFIDFWGFDVNHDWPWWRVQFPYFIQKYLGY